VGMYSKARARTRRRAATMAVAVAAASTMAVAGASAQEPVEYVNLGDSFSAGAGVQPTVPGSHPNCSRSERNFAHVVAANRGYALTDVSCGGAKTEDFYRAQYPGLAPQLDALAESTDLVTMTIGGNNNNTFAMAMARCIGAAVARLGAWNPCQEQYGDSLADEVRTQTYPALLQALRDVHARAPHAEVAIVGYPWLLPPSGSCVPQMPLAAGDVPYLYSLQATLNDAVARAAADTGTLFVDMAQSSVGRDGCQSPEQRWIEPMIGALQPVPVHPNAAGEQAMADAVLAAVG
jgi:lysophospholipase L1-like esterase